MLLTLTLLGLSLLRGEAAPPPARPIQRAQLRADLDGDGHAERVEWFLRARPERGRSRGFLRVEIDGRARLSPVYRAFKARAADVDGDGRDEILLGVWSDTPRHVEPEPHRTVWVLSWVGGRFIERWRGSALARPLIDFTVSADGRRLIALERAGGLGWMTVYAWTGFGFAGVDRWINLCAPPDLYCLFNFNLDAES